MPRRTSCTRGELFGIFPEGTRSRSGTLHKGRTGAARLAMKIGCPIFPVGIVGTDSIQPPDAKVPKLFASCQIKIGRPIRPERYQNRGAEHIAWRSMIDEVMYEIRELTGQTYVNTYAGATAETEPTVAARVASVTDVGRIAVRVGRPGRATRIRRRRRPLTTSNGGRAPPNRTRLDPGLVVSWADDVHDHDFPSRWFRACPPRARDPLDLAASIGSGLKKAAVAATVDGKETDLTTELTDGAVVSIITSDTDEGRHVLRHSTSHVLAQAVTQLFPGAKFSIGPAIENGFYYDFDLPNGQTFSDDDLGRIEARMREIMQSNQPFTRSEMSMSDAKALFADQSYKVEIIEKVEAAAQRRDSTDGSTPASTSRRCRPTV